MEEVFLKLRQIIICGFKIIAVWTYSVLSFTLYLHFNWLIAKHKNYIYEKPYTRTMV